jgi:chemotaxis response regulator CheB
VPRPATPGEPAAPLLRQVDEGVPIVGVGASAGGLEALEELFRTVPPKSGLAFVVVQHLDPHHKGMPVELLQRSTSLEVLQARGRLRVEADKIYVIPPDRDLSILHGVLHLFPPAAPRGFRMPIDFFLWSLATDQRERSVGVILSGMGSDGTLGLAAIKEQAGACFVQDPASAKFDGMPRSAIDAGVADVVAPAGELASKIVAYLARAPRARATDVVVEAKAHSAIEKICLLLRAATGHDFCAPCRPRRRRRQRRTRCRCCAA